MTLAAGADATGVGLCLHIYNINALNRGDDAATRRMSLSRPDLHTLLFRKSESTCFTPCQTNPPNILCSPIYDTNRQAHIRHQMARHTDS